MITFVVIIIIIIIIIIDVVIIIFKIFYCYYYYYCLDNFFPLLISEYTEIKQRYNFFALCDVKKIFLFNNLACSKDLDFGRVSYE